MKLSVLFAVLLATLSAQVAGTEVLSGGVWRRWRDRQTIHFFCSEGYDKDECLRDVAALRKALAPYPLRLLGEWSFYLVLAPDWKPLAIAMADRGQSGIFSAAGTGHGDGSQLVLGLG